MAEQLLDQIRSQIRARVRELEPAVREAESLEAALSALGTVTSAQLPAARHVAPSQPSRKRRPRLAKAGRSAKRAPRGANRAAVLKVLDERPGVSVSELASATDIARPVLYNLLKTLEERREVAKEQLPSGTTGYRRTLSAAASAGTSSSSAAGTP